MNEFWYFFCKPFADLARSCLLVAFLMFLMLIGAILRSALEWLHKTLGRLRR